MASAFIGLDLWNNTLSRFYPLLVLVVPIQLLLPFQIIMLFLVSTVISYGLHDILKFSKIF